MSADWMTCRVVRDGKGRLRTDDGPIRGLVGDGLVSAESAAAYEHMLGPLTPVLDADGLPVVTTVGDLTARHLFGAATIAYRTEGEISTGVIERTIPIPDGRLRLLMHAPGNRAAQWDDMLSLDTPCEVLP